MGSNEKHPIIANGQYYVEPLKKRNSGGSKANVNRIMTEIN